MDGSPYERRTYVGGTWLMEGVGYTPKDGWLAQRALTNFSKAMYLIKLDITPHYLGVHGSRFYAYLEIPLIEMCHFKTSTPYLGIDNTSVEDATAPNVGSLSTSTHTSIQFSLRKENPLPREMMSSSLPVSAPWPLLSGLSSPTALGPGIFNARWVREQSGHVHPSVPHQVPSYV
jgi:hypothetical protein